MKTLPFVAVNPNGRVPAIEDPNTGITLWESGAIMEYLIETYDKGHKLSYPTAAERWHCKQWLAFQISGQGPYWGQAVWFTHYHSEKLPSARQRYVAEVERVIGVLDSWLKAGDKLFLVGDRCTYADLAFLTWTDKVPEIDLEGNIDVKARYQAYYEWVLRLKERPVVKKVLEDMARAIAAEAAQG
jgi:glutathione S-transferase